MTPADAPDADAPDADAPDPADTAPGHTAPAHTAPAHTTPAHTTVDGRPRFYGRRHGKALTARRQALMATHLPALAVTPPAVADSLDPRTLFPAPPAAVWLEIGFGGGEHLAARAAARPDWGFLGCEPFVNGVASLLSHLADGGQTNVRLFPDDARRLLPGLAPGTVDGVFVLYPDPWPKTRHAPRRLLGADTLPHLARLLKPGGTLFTASDDPVMIRWMLEQVRGHDAFTWTARHPDHWRQPPPDWPGTRYEAKALAAGRQPFYGCFQRV